MTTSQTIDRRTIYALAAETGCDPRTIRDFIRGKRRTYIAFEIAIRRAAEKLGVALPQVQP